MDRRPNHGHLVLLHVNDPVAVTLGAFLQPGDDDLPAHEARSAFGATRNIQICSQLFLHNVDLLTVVSAQIFLSDFHATNGMDFRRIKRSPLYTMTKTSVFCPLCLRISKNFLIF